jgi:gliding motility-associated-like protein
MNGRFIWDFGDGNVVDTTVNAIDHVYTDYGNFVPRIILKEPSGACIIPLTGKDTIRMLGIKPKFFIDSLRFCDEGTVNITDSTTTNDPVLSYNWDMGDGTTYTTNSNFQHRYDSAGVYFVKLQLSTPNGCIDSLTRGPVKVYRTPRFDIITDSIFCANEKITHNGVLRYPDSLAVSWQWKFPNGNTSTLQNPAAQQYPTPGTQAIQAIAKSANGCADTVSKNLFVHALPKIDVPASMVKMVGVPLKIPAKYPQNVVAYNWSPADNLDCNDCPQPTTVTKFPTKYIVTATDSNSCRNTATVNVVVLCKGATVFVPNTFSPNGDGNNDVLYVRGQGLDRVKSFRVFNRWGELVFEKRDFPTNNAAYGWNGLYKGQPIQSDVYIYQAEVYCENGELMRFEGNLALIR